MDSSVSLSPPDGLPPLPRRPALCSPWPAAPASAECRVQLPTYQPAARRPACFPPSCRLFP